MTNSMLSETAPPHSPARRATPVTPGKFAMWLFLSTEVMFFTGLIGSYIVYRAGSSLYAYSNLYPPATDLSRLRDKVGVLIESAGPDAHKVLDELVHAGLARSSDAAARLVEAAPRAALGGLTNEKAAELAHALKAAGATVRIEPLKTHKWPLPYDDATNPLAVTLTAFNTFVLICSSVTMALSLAAIRQGRRWKSALYLLATILIGSLFLGVQIFEYHSLMFVHHYPVGISASGHFRPDVSLFASCFFTMTGFHGAHVTAGVLALVVILVRSLLMGGFSAQNHAPIEMVGLYWHFVDLVWIILFTIVYLI